MHSIRWHRLEVAFEMQVAVKVDNSIDYRRRLKCRWQYKELIA